MLLLKGGEILILYHVKRVLFVVIVFTLTLFTMGKAFADSFPRAIASNNSVYLVSDTEVDINNIGEEIGKIDHQRSPMPKKNGESNVIPIGSLIFEIKAINTQDAVAVKVNTKFYFASHISSLQSTSSRKTLLLLSVITVLVLIIVITWRRNIKS